MGSFETCLQLARADAEVRRRLEVQGLSLNDLAALHHLADAPGGTVRRIDLADRLGLTPSGVTRLLAPLEKLGYVGRTPDPNDARRALVTLTDAGAARTREAIAVAEERADALLQRVLSPDERVTLRELLARVAPFA